MTSAPDTAQTTTGESMAWEVMKPILWVLPPVPGDFHAQQSWSNTGLLCTLSWARLKSLLCPASLLGTLLFSSGWALGFLMCVLSAPPSLSCTPSSVGGDYLCLIRLHCAVHALGELPVPHSTPLPCTLVRAWHCTPHLREVWRWKNQPISQ